MSNPLIGADPKELPGIIETLDNIRNHPQATELDQILINIIEFLVYMELNRIE